MFLKYLDDFKNQFHGDRLIRKLKLSELEVLSNLASKLAEIPDADNRMLAINRAFIDQPAKPKNWSIINEILTCANSMCWHAEQTMGQN